MNGELLSPLLVLVLLLNFFVLGVSRLKAVIWAVAAQGLLLGVSPLLAHEGPTRRVVGLALATIFVKGLVIPRTMFFAIREVHMRREIEPLVGFIPSLLLGVLGTALAIAFASTLPLAVDGASSKGHVEHTIVSAALSTVLTGFLLLTTRRKAIMQVLGYIVLENGIFIFGLLLLKAMPVLVEFGVLLDLFVGVFVMGIILYHINREFSSVSTEVLSALKE